MKNRTVTDLQMEHNYRVTYEEKEDRYYLIKNEKNKHERRILWVSEVSELDELRFDMMRNTIVDIEGLKSRKQLLIALYKD